MIALRRSLVTIGGRIDDLQSRYSGQRLFQHIVTDMAIRQLIAEEKARRGGGGALRPRLLEQAAEACRDVQRRH